MHPRLSFLAAVLPLFVACGTAPPQTPPGDESPSAGAPPPVSRLLNGFETDLALQGLEKSPNAQFELVEGPDHAKEGRRALKIRFVPGPVDAVSGRRDGGIVGFKPNDVDFSKAKAVAFWARAMGDGTPSLILSCYTNYPKDYFFADFKTDTKWTLVKVPVIHFVKEGDPRWDRINLIGFSYFGSDPVELLFDGIRLIDGNPIADSARRSPSRATANTAPPGSRLLNDFEDDIALQGMAKSPNAKAELVEGPDQAKEGQRALNIRFDPRDDASSGRNGGIVGFKSNDVDFSKVKAVSFWARATVDGTPSLTLSCYTIFPRDHFSAEFKMDKKWALVKVPVGRFAREGDPTWNRITLLSFAYFGSDPFDFLVDDIRLLEE